MAKIPIKFKRVAAAFDDAANWTRPCGGSSSGSEYWPESGTDLSDLVNSFIEKDGHGLNLGNESSDDNWISYKEKDNYVVRRKLLQILLLECSNNDRVKQKICHEINVALKLINGCYNISGVNDVLTRRNLKRNVMVHLRAKGFDAGVCKSQWEKTDRLPAGTYDYIDVHVDKTRYIVELFLAGEFEIARPTNQYTKLLQTIPSILIIEKPQLLKQLITLMTAAMKESLNQANMHIAPWRRHGYIQAKYLSPYKRTINPESSAMEGEREGLSKKNSSLVLEATEHPVRKVSYYCRDGSFGRKVVNGVRVGLLATVLQGN